jgi:hypothetical protein
MPQKTVSIIADTDPVSYSEWAFIVDYSADGARLRSNLPLAPGQKVQILPGEGSNRAVPGRVVRVRPVNGGVEAEVEFLRGARLPYDRA